MRRSFDLLTRPLFDDESIETGANISWVGARNFQVTVDPEVAPYFEIESTFDTARKFSVVARRVGKCDELVRFAALVSCDTDEVSPQEREPSKSDWPPLRSSKDIDPPFRGPRGRGGGTSAWAQMIVQRQKMLDAFDQAKAKARAHAVQTLHGRVAEAEFRAWLARFLPKRYGVTSGFVVSQGQRGDAVFPHYDVIIYDVLDAPVLWVDDHPDASSAGTSQAIPAQYVRAVLEVKSTFGSDEAKDAMSHLQELAPFCAGFDSPAQLYKQFLPRGFFSAVIFFDASSASQRSSAALEHLVPVDTRRGFYGAVILRGEARHPEHAGHIKILQHPDGSLEPFPIWGPPMFTMFAFDLVALLEGTYAPNRVSSFFAFNPLDGG